MWGGAQVCARLEEERRSNGEMRRGLEREREDLRSQLQDATNEVSHPLHDFLSVRHDPLTGR